MKKPLIFAHRGGMGNCIENTIPCFKIAVKIGVNIETDLQLTKDNKLICYHDHHIKIDSEWYDIKKLTLVELKNIKFEDNREIPTTIEVFNALKNYANDLRYSCDIRDIETGLKLIDIATEFDILDKIEITERNNNVLLKLREYNKEIKLVHTLTDSISSINDNIDVEILKDLKIEAINIQSWRANIKNLKQIIDFGFKCYVWGVNKESRMKKVLNLTYNGEVVSAIYTDYPDIFVNLRKEISTWKI
jgi:glycerophosphoryl diester phosphodiesterase